MIKTIIKFHADWCRPCQMMKPVFESVQNELPNNIYKEINIDHNQTMASKYGVTSIPTTIILTEGRVIGRHTGFMSKQQLKKFIEDTNG